MMRRAVGMGIAGLLAGAMALAGAGCKRRETGPAPTPPPGPEPVKAGRTAGETVTVDLGDGVTLELAWCPPGRFTMGSPADEPQRHRGERPHNVTLTRGFWIGRHEVTQRQWRRIMDANPARFTDGGPEAPVEQVSWEDCRGFLDKLNARVPGGGFRLPTEAEWEYACRAGTSGPFHFGADLDASLANFNGVRPYGRGAVGAARACTLPVGSFQPNGWGLHDMHGNVAEWCADWHGDYPEGDATDPTGPEKGEFRIFRGGSWTVAAWGLRSAYRYRSPPDYRHGSLGFRVIREASAP